MCDIRLQSSLLKNMYLSHAVEPFLEVRTSAKVLIKMHVCSVD